MDSTLSAFIPLFSDLCISLSCWFSCPVKPACLPCQAAPAELPASGVTFHLPHLYLSPTCWAVTDQRSRCRGMINSASSMFLSKAVNILFLMFDPMSSQIGSYRGDAKKSNLWKRRENVWLISHNSQLKKSNAKKCNVQLTLTVCFL